MRLKVSSAKMRPFRLGLIVLIERNRGTPENRIRHGGVCVITYMGQ